MSWWQRLVPARRPTGPGVADVQVTPDGWTAASREPRTASWRDRVGNTLTLDIREDFDLAADPDPPALQAYFRRLAESHEAGLIEAESAPWKRGSSAHGIYKKRSGTGFTFVGILHMPTPAASLIWAIAATERGTTGVREALVTALQIERGGFSPDDFNLNFAQDPYDPSYRALNRVDSAVLRYASDDAAYDGIAPGHPLTRVRSTIRDLRAQVDVDPAAFGFTTGS